MYFESTINYWTDNPDGFKPPRIPVKRTILVRAYTYTEVEAITTDWGSNQDNRTGYMIHKEYPLRFWQT